MNHKISAGYENQRQAYPQESNCGSCIQSIAPQRGHVPFLIFILDEFLYAKFLYIQEVGYTRVLIWFHNVYPSASGVHTENHRNRSNTRFYFAACFSQVLIRHMRRFLGLEASSTRQPGHGFLSLP